MRVLRSTDSGRGKLGREPRHRSSRLAPKRRAGALRSPTWAACSLWLTLAGIAGCQPSTDTIAPHSRPSDTASAAASDSAAPGNSGARTTAPVPKSPLAGQWTAHFTVARASVHVPAGIHYPAWKGQADAGRSGSGELHVLVDDAGEVNGAITGALGELTVRGKVEENELRAGVRPAVDSSDAPMYGVLVGQRRGNHIEGHLQASSGDGEQVRQATLLLEPKNP